MPGMRSASQWDESMHWEHVWSGTEFKRDKIPKWHASLCPETNKKPKTGMNKNYEQDTWLFPVNSKRYHFPEVWSSRYGISEGQGKDPGWRLEQTVHSLSGKGKEGGRKEHLKWGTKRNESVAHGGALSMHGAGGSGPGQKKRPVRTARRFLLLRHWL